MTSAPLARASALPLYLRINAATSRASRHSPKHDRLLQANRDGKLHRRKSVYVHSSTPSSPAHYRRFSRRATRAEKNIYIHTETKYYIFNIFLFFYEKNLQYTSTECVNSLIRQRISWSRIQPLRAVSCLLHRVSIKLTHTRGFCAFVATVFLKRLRRLKAATRRHSSNSSFSRIYNMIEVQFRFLTQLRE